MAGNTATVTPPGYPRDQVAGALLSESYREFRESTLPYGNRFRLSGRADMLKGKRVSPHEYAIRFLVAGKQAGLSKRWALRFISWLRLAVEALYPPTAACRDAAEMDEERIEGAVNVKRLRYQQTGSPEDREAWLNAQHEEVAAEIALLHAHGRMVELH